LVGATPAYVAPEARTVDVARKPFGDDIGIQEVLRTLNRRRWLIAAVVCVALGAAVIYNATATRIYEARARVLVQPAADEVVPFRSSSEDPGRGDYFVTQLDILRSQALARQTLDRQHLLSKDPAQHPGQVSAFLAALSVTTTKTDMGESRALNLMFRSGDPKHAAQMINGLAQAVDQNLELRKEVSAASADG
jgi:uncharacterized protein involved in exopolysaccharide biosynthesis